MNNKISGSLMEGKPTDEYLGLLLGQAMVAIAGGERAVYGGHRWGSIKRAIESLGVKDEDLVTLESGIGQGGNGFYVVDEVDGGIKEVREVTR